MERGTHRMPNMDGIEHTIKWGTATLNPDAKLKLHVLGMPEPISIQLIYPVVLGRAHEENKSNVHVDLSPCGALEQGVSRLHASLELAGKTVMLTDLGSTNGTFLNGQRLLPKQRRVVRDNDEVRLGKLIIHVYF